MVWYCDSCGQPIQQPEDGWVEWIRLVDQTPGGRNLRLVHRFNASPRKDYQVCQFNQEVEFKKDQGTVADASLPEFLGPDGLMRLLVFLADDELPKDEVLEMIKRLYIPDYEQVRPHIKEAVSSGAVELSSRLGYPWQSEISAVLKFIEDRDSR